ncbi:MAG: hypothetical protein NT040_10585 [Bacteroidetes bacterium]|nr:hypothetical protein [Bacteroidota bacterium]
MAVSNEVHAQNRTVYVTLDVSKSMQGDKYNLANYTIQLLTCLLDEKDELYLGIYGCIYKIDLTAQQDQINNLQTIKFQKEQKSLIAGLNKVFCDNDFGYTESGDIYAFSRYFRNNHRENWLFIVGDGIWNVDGKYLDGFSSLLTNSEIKCYHLQTGTNLKETNAFAKFLNTRFGDIPQIRSSTDPGTIIGGCLQISSAILGIGKNGLAIEKKGAKDIVTRSEYSLKKLYVFYQESAGLSQIPDLLTARQGKRVLKLERSRTITDERIVSGNKEKLISGKAWIITAPQNSQIESGKEISFEFSKDIRGILSIFPVLDLTDNEQTPLVKTGSPDKINAKTWVICPENDSISLRSVLTFSDGKMVPASLLKNTTFQVLVSNNIYKGRFNGNQFCVSIPVSKDTVFYTLEYFDEGYYHYFSEVRRVIRSKDCKYADDWIAGFVGRYSSTDLRKNNCLNGYILLRHEKDSAVLDVSGYILKVKHNHPLLFKNITIEVDGKMIRMCPERRGYWCDCFIPDTLFLTIDGTPVQGNAHNSFSYKIKIPIVKDVSWFLRCKWIIITILALLGILIYLFAILRKIRFSPGAAIKTTYSTATLKNLPPSRRKLREKGFLAWFARWLLPFGPETSTQYYSQPGKSFRFVASRSHFHIHVDKKSYVSNQMTCSVYDASDKKPYFILGDGESININKVSNIPNATFSVCYNYDINSVNDIIPFKIFIVALILSFSVITICLVGLLFSSIF